jgi:hypothetical protein
MLAQGAVSAIKQGCSMLHEGRMQLEGAKSTIEGVQADLKAIKGLWDWLIGLFASKPDKPIETKPVAKAKAKKDESYEALELETIKNVGVQLGNFFDIQAQLTNYYASLEAESKERYDPTQNTSKKAIERALVELQMENLDGQIREQMTIYAPAELKAIYTRFLKMYSRIQQEQEWARAEEVRKMRLARWQKEQEEIRAIELTSGVVAVVFISLLFGWLMWQLRVLSGGF